MESHLHQSNMSLRTLLCTMISCWLPIYHGYFATIASFSISHSIRAHSVALLHHLSFPQTPISHNTSFDGRLMHDTFTPFPSVSLTDLMAHKQSAARCVCWNGYPFSPLWNAHSSAVAAQSCEDRQIHVALLMIIIFNIRENPGRWSSVLGKPKGSS